jgi:hypothetical protein
MSKRIVTTRTSCSLIEQQALFHGIECSYTFGFLMFFFSLNVSKEKELFENWVVVIVGRKIGIFVWIIV